MFSMLANSQLKIKDSNGQAQQYLDTAYSCIKP